MDNTPAARGKKANCFTVHDPFAEALYCRASFAEPVGDPDRIGCSLIIEMKSEDIRTAAGVLCRYRKENGQ